jgi:hypothetical protein
MIDWRARGLAALSFAVAFGIPAAAGAHAETTHRVVDGIEIYVGILPADAMREQHPKDHVEHSMHRGIPKGAGYYHVNVSLFDSTTKAELSDLQVQVQVEELGGLGHQAKKMEPMVINKTTSYGNYFKMVGQGPFWITVQIRRPGWAEAIETKFQHRH